MARKQRIDLPGGRHHVMNRGVNRQRVFFGDADRVEFGRLLGEIAEMFGVRVLAYCLLDNHYHLLLHCPDGNLSMSMKHLGAVYTRHTNDRVGRDGPLFRGRFRSILVDNDPYLLTAHRYIHRNALDVSGVERVEDYRWSSHRSYLGLRRCPDFLDRSILDDHFGGDSARFHRFVSQPMNRTVEIAIDFAELRCLVELAVVRHESDADVESAIVRMRTPFLAVLPMLSEAVQADVRRHLGDPSVSAIGRARRRLRCDPQLQAIVGTVVAELGLLRHAA